MSWRRTAFALVVAALATSGGLGAQEKKDDKKPAPAGTGKPCDCKKTEPGYYCLKCDRELTQDDVRGGVCKRCETKPAKIEYCVKPGAVRYIPTCHPDKASDKPVT